LPWRGSKEARALADPVVVLQQHFVVLGLSSLVVAGFSAVLVASAPA
jgi:hypothetical protein